MVVCGAYPYILQPVGLVDGRMPAGFVYGRINYVLHLPKGLPHHVDVWDFQEVELYVGVEAFTFIPPILCLHVMEEAEIGKARVEASKRKREKSASISDVSVRSEGGILRRTSPRTLRLETLLHLVGDGHAALPGIKDGEFVGLSVGVHDDLEKTFVFFTATI